MFCFFFARALPSRGVVVGTFAKAANVAGAHGKGVAPLPMRPLADYQDPEFELITRGRSAELGTVEWPAGGAVLVFWVRGASAGSGHPNRTGGLRR